MKKNKIALGLLAGSLVAGAIPAAAAPADVTDKGQATAVDRLSSFEVITGYEDGTFKPENNITRAEFAAIAVRLLGLEDAAKVSTGATKFKDVAASHWASGYINLAVGQGILKGYPDGSYKPEANVTYAESLAILVRLLGYEPAVKGQWPNNYIAQAGSLGLTKSVGAVSANTPATRGNIAIFANQALDVPKMIQTGFGTDVKFVVSGTENTDEQTLVTENFNLDEYVFDEDGVDNPDTEAEEDIFVVTDTKRSNDNLKANEIEINGDVYELGQNVKYNVSDLLGHYVSFSAKGDTIVSLKVETTEVVGNVGGDTTADELDIDFVGGDESYDLASGLNGFDYSNEVRAVIYEGDVIYVDEYNWTDKFVVNEVEVDDEEIELDGVALDGSVSNIDTSEAVYADGSAVKPEDIKVGDLVLVNDTNSDQPFIKVVKAGATGELETYANGLDEITVGGKDYDLVSTFDVSTDNNDGLESNRADALADLLGTEVTVYFDAEGDVIHVSGDVDGDATSSNSDYVVFLQGQRNVDSFGTDKIQVLNASGAKVTYEINSSTEVNYESNGNNATYVAEVAGVDAQGNPVDRDGADVNATAPVEDAADGFVDQWEEVLDYNSNFVATIDVNDEGEVEEITIENNVADHGDVIDTDKDSNLVLFDNVVGQNDGADAWYKVNEDTIFFDAVDGDTYTGSEFAALNTDANANKINVSAVKLDGNVVEVAIVTEDISGFSGSTDADELFVVSKITEVAGDDVKYTLVDGKGESKTYLVDKDDVGNNVIEGSIVEVDIAGDRLTDIVVSGQESARAYLTTQAVNKDDEWLNGSYLSDDVVILDGSDDFAKLTLSDLEDLAEDEAYEFSMAANTGDDDQLIDFVVVFDEDNAPQAPTNPQAQAGVNRVALTWTAAVDANNNVDEYEIYRSTTNVFADARKIATSASTSYTDTTAVAGTQYFYFIKAVDKAGNKSTQSVSVSGTAQAPANN